MIKNISERDKKLLIVVLMVAVVMLPYFLFIQPTMEKNAVLENEISTLEQTRLTLQQHQANVPFYREQMELMRSEEEALLEYFPADLLQENMIMFIDTAEKTTPIELYQVGFSEHEAVEITSAEVEQAHQAMAIIAGVGVGNDAADQTGDPGEDTSGDSNAVIKGAALSGVTGDDSSTVALAAEEVPAPDATTAGTLPDAGAVPAGEEPVAGGGLSGIFTSSQFTYACGYEEFKTFLDSIRDYRERLVIDNLSASFSSELNEVSGSFSLRQYAVSGAERSLEVVDKPQIPQGSNNIFMDAVGGSVAPPTTGQTADYFILFNSPDALSDAKTVGRSGDATGSTELSSDENSEQEIAITFEGEAGSYTADYTIGDDGLDGGPNEFEKDGPIYLEIISRPRETGDRDEVAGIISIVNRTDQTVYVTVNYDDPVQPRVNIMEITGDVVILD